MRSFGESGDRDGDSLQRRALAAYVAMTARSEDWARRLVLLAASDDATAFALATLAAGGAVLWTCADEAMLREGGQAGVTDFQVTTLSEALRILKNEIRKGLPVSVGVLDSANTVWDEAAERGVQPHALLAGPREAGAAEILVGRGATRVVMPLEVVMKEHCAATWRERRAGDEELLAGTEGLGERERAVAVRWLRAAPRLFPRDTVRCYAAAWAASKDDR